MLVAMFVLAHLLIVSILLAGLAFIDEAEDAASGFCIVGILTFGLPLAILALINFGLNT